MKIIQGSFNKYLDKNYLFEKNPQIAVAVSGGPDSMCLAFLLDKWIKKCNGSLIALIVNHKIRKDSYKEANFIKNYLSNYNIKTKILNIDNKKVLKKNMNEARDNRFDKLIKYCSNNNILHLFLGHHYDDNLETYLLRRLAGSNFEGLNCIQKLLSNKNLQILRPLLAYSKEDILFYNNKNKIAFIIDPSNSNSKYSRVIVRSFLSNNRLHRKEIEKDFKLIKRYYLPYKKMIYQKFNNLYIQIYKKKIVIDGINFFKEDLEIQCRIFQIIYKYLNFEKKFLRSKKILLILKILAANKDYEVNLGGMYIKKDEFLMNFAL